VQRNDVKPRDSARLNELQLQQPVEPTPHAVEALHAETHQIGHGTKAEEVSSALLCQRWALEQGEEEVQSEVEGEAVI
jgi:hypothetical protein